MNITCSALPEQLLESELFGHERGAFTDAGSRSAACSRPPTAARCSSTRSARWSPALQAKLLRFLEEKTFKRVGGAGDIRVDVRVIAATNRNLEEQVAKGGFREDLFYRLNVLPIALPPLREHADDMPALVDFYVDVFNAEFRRSVCAASAPAALRRCLQGYGWPGNVRELRNAVERAMLLADGTQLEAHDFPALLKTGAASRRSVRAARRRRRSRGARAQPRRAGARASGRNQTKAAALLGLNRDQIRYRIEKFGLSVTP